MDPMDQGKAAKSFFWKKKNEGLIEGCTCKGNKRGHGDKVTSFLLLYHLLKGFTIVSITRKLEANCLLKL